ncbi:MAG TPA: PilN domain-containing protein [Thermoanaerobaculia bacterium]|nr:PilN domain-containing protein [Thermoanaerobaculia bacterium]
MIKINLLREGRGGARAAATPAGAPAAGPANLGPIALFAPIILGLLLAGGWWFMKSREVKAKEAEVAALEQEASRLKRFITEAKQFEDRRSSLEKRIALINQLKQNQKGPVRLLDHVSRALPDLVWLDRMSLSGQVITIAGQTLNPNAAATFVENIKADPMFDEPQFNVLSSRPNARGTGVYAFDMRFNFKYLIEDAPAEGAEEASGAPVNEGTAAQPKS